MVPVLPPLCSSENKGKHPSIFAFTSVSFCLQRLSSPRHHPHPTYYVQTECSFFFSLFLFSPLFFIFFYSALLFSSSCPFFFTRDVRTLFFCHHDTCAHHHLDTHPMEIEIKNNSSFFYYDKSGQSLSETFFFCSPSSSSSSCLLLVAVFLFFFCLKTYYSLIHFFLFL